MSRGTAAREATALGSEIAKVCNVTYLAARQSIDLTVSNLDTAFG